MIPSKNGLPASDLPAGLAQPALRALAVAGITRLAQFTAVKEADLLKLHGFGPKGLALIRSALAARGLSFAPVDRNRVSNE